MAAGNWGRHYKRFNFLWNPQQEEELRIPQSFWNTWGDEVDDIIEVFDPVGNHFHCEVNRDEEGGIFTADLTMTLRHQYHVEDIVMVYFRMLKGDVFLIRIEATPDVEYNYPWFNNGRQRWFDDEDDGVLSEESVCN